MTAIIGRSWRVIRKPKSDTVWATQRRGNRVAARVGKRRQALLPGRCAAHRGAFLKTDGLRVKLGERRTSELNTSHMRGLRNQIVVQGLDLFW